MILYLVRHGYSMANQKRLVTGTPKDCLTDAGRDQATRLGNWLSSCGLAPDHHFVSQWGRARETAELAFPGRTWTVDPRLGETDAGAVADLPLQSFLADYPDFYADPARSYPGGESHFELNQRVLGWLNELWEAQCNSVLAVTHSGPITCLLQHVLKMDMSSFPAFVPIHASLSVVRYQRTDGDWEGRLAGFSLGPCSVVQAITHG